MKRLSPAIVLLAALPLVQCGSKSSPEAGRGERLLSEEAGVRPARLAGTWYLADPVQLRNRLNLYLERAGTIEVHGRPIALVSPHAGYRFSGQAAAYGYKALRGKGVKRVILMGVSHSVPFMGASIPDVTHFKTPLGSVPVDRAAAAKLLESPLISVRPEVHVREHSVEMQVPMLQAALGPSVKIVPMVFGALKDEDYEAVAAQLREVIDEETVVVASSDFMHYGERFNYQPFKKSPARNIEIFDRQAIERILARDLPGFREHYAKTGNTICGRVPIGVLLALLPEKARGSLLRYYRSGELTGKWEGSVSYASVLFTDGKGPPGKPPVLVKGSERQRRESAMLGPQEQREIVALARETVDTFVKSGRVPDQRMLAAAVGNGLKKTTGVFVTLKRGGHLRGCIGHIVGVVPLYSGVVQNAVNACSRDRRFQPVQPGELADIAVEVSVLSPPEPVDSYDRILPGWHGIVLKAQGRQAVFLPQVALEFNWSLEETLSQLSRKAGLPVDAWKAGALFEVFEAQIIPE